MQAGERIAFVTNADLIDLDRVYTDQLEPNGQDHILELFREILFEVITKHFNTKRTERLKGQADIYLHEIPLIVTMSDGSFLHVLISWVGNDESGNTGRKIELRITEHGIEEEIVKSYWYQEDEGSLIRIDMDHSMNEERVYQKFSLIRALNRMVLLEEALSSDSDAEKELALAARHKLDTSAEVLADEKQMGFNAQPVNINELVMLQDLLHSAQPYED